MAESDLFCLPTRSEGFCTSVLEAASWGLPCVISDVGGVREVYGTDPVFAKILGDRTPESISQAILASRQEGLVGHFPDLERKVEKSHTWEQTATRLEALYDNV
jgi:glycosyltransferase involved in cell wall biosynthesis